MLGPISAFLSSVTWVSGSSAYAHLSRRYVPGAVNFNRALVALPLFALTIGLDHQGVRATVEALGPSGVRDSTLWLVLSMMSSYVIGDSLFMYAALSLGFSAAQAITATYPLWATLAALSFSQEPLSLGSGAGLCITVAGVIAVVVSTHASDHRAPPGSLSWLERKDVGVLLALACSLAWALNSFAVARGGQTLHLALAGAIRNCVALLLCPLVARAQSRGGLRLLFDRTDYRRFLPLIALESFAGSAVYIYGLSHSPMAIGATLSSLAPVLSVPMAVFLGWERFSWPKAFGVCLVVVGIALLLVH